MTFLAIAANIAAILTAVFAAWAGIYVVIDLRKKRRKLEDYLQQVRSSATGDDKGQRTILHLTARLGLTEAEILHASFRSKRIIRTLAANKETGRADAMLLGYEKIQPKQMPDGDP
ncbi:MAG: hypothetical protein OEU46_20095 [Alphaproteobacteria bacterium]|nr:hypothetical protein [Alphaproteobacteria bacterium]